MYRIIDYATRKEVAPSDLVFTGEDRPWEVEMDLELIRSRVNVDYFRKSPALVSKYLPFLPIHDWATFVSLGEGGTPLIRSKRIERQLGVELYFKVESKSPTGSFKDRGSAVEVTIAKEMGARGIVVASTGNMAASCACYAAAANVPCFVFVPEDVPASKLAQVIGFGGRIVQVKGTYNDAARLAVEAARKLNFYLAGDYAFRIEGAKTAAFEVIDQLYFEPPDMVLVPMGCGTNLASYAKGFSEFHELGLIDRVPRLIGVQAEGAAAIVHSFDQGRERVEPLVSVQTMATAIAVPDPLDGQKAIDSIRRTGGRALAVSDAEMLESQYLLSREEGIFVELSGGAVLAALTRLAREPGFRAKRVVCVLCGDGLKDPSTVLKMAIKPPTIAPEIGEFISLYESSFFEGKTVAFLDQQQVLFDREPTAEEIRAEIERVFEVEYGPALIDRIRQIICRFLAKGKSITFSDLQDIVQDAIEHIELVDGPGLKVVDFEVTTGKDRKPRASVSIAIGTGRFSGCAEGVGPVDALIEALRIACRGELEFELKSYSVDIRSEGADAVVLADLKLSRDGKTSVGRGVSPDIIQASIEAFEEAYNGL